MLGLKRVAPAALEVEKTSSGSLMTSGTPNQEPLTKNISSSSSFEKQCVYLETKNHPLNQSDLDHLCQQFRDAMRDFQGVSVADLKLVFSSQSNAVSTGVASLSSTLQSKSTSLQKAVQEAKLFGTTKATKQSSPENNLKDQTIERLQHEKGELKKRLRESSADVDTWKSTCEEQKERIQSLEAGSSASMGSLDYSDHSHSSSKRRGVSRTPVPVGFMSFPKNISRHRPKTCRRRNSAPVVDEESSIQELEQTKSELEDLKATGKEQAEAELEGVQKRLREANRDVADWKATYKKQQERIESLESEAEPLRETAKTLEETVRGLEVENETKEERIQHLKAENEDLVQKLQSKDEEISLLLKSEETVQSNSLEKSSEQQKAQTDALFKEMLAPGVEDRIVLVEDNDGTTEDKPTAGYQQSVKPSQQDLYLLVQRLEGSKQEALQSQVKLVEQIKQTNDCETRLETCHQQVEELRRHKVNLQGQLQVQEEVISTAKAAVAELEENLATQQLQIESLSVVNREQRQQLLDLQQDESDYHSLPSSLESLGAEDKDDRIDTSVRSRVEVLEDLWDHQQAEVATIQQDQDILFGKLSKKNSDATSKIDRLCDSIGELSVEEGSEPDGNGRDDILTDAADLLEVIQEGGETDSSTSDSEAVIERFEIAWMQQTEEIEALQRDQDMLLSRLRASSSGDEDPKLSKELHTQNKIIKTLQADNKQLIQKLREAGTSEELQKELELHMAKNEELELKIKQQESQSSIDALKEEQVALLRSSENLRDLLREKEAVCEKQRSTIAQVEEEKLSAEREAESQKLLLEKAEALSTQHTETIDCLRGERKTLEQVLDDHRRRTKEFEAVCSFQKTAIGGLQAEKSCLMMRLLDTEQEFRKHLSNNLRVQEQITELKDNLAFVAAGRSKPPHAVQDASVERVDSENLNIRDFSFQTDTTVTTSFEEAEILHPSADKDEDWADAESTDSDCPNVTAPSKEDYPDHLPTNGAEELAVGSSDKMKVDDLLQLLSFSVTA